MKILCETLSDNLHHHRRGLAEIFKALNHQFIYWNPTEKPSFDIFDENEPDIFLATSDPLTRATAKCLAEHHRLIPIFIKKIPLAADTFTFSPGTTRKDYASDAVYVGNYHSELHDVYINPLCNHPKLKFKICGTKPWPVPQYLGLIHTENIRHFYASAEIALNFRGVERLYQILTSGGLPVSLEIKDSVFSSDNILMTNDPLKFQYFISHTDKKTREEMKRKGINAITHSHTYWHRVAELFKGLGFDREGARTLKVYEQQRTTV